MFAGTTDSILLSFWFVFSMDLNDELILWFEDRLKSEGDSG